MKIQVTIRKVYGRENIYPACEKADNFCRLLGQATLTHDNITIIKDLGYTVEVVSQHPATL